MLSQIKRISSTFTYCELFPLPSVLVSLQEEGLGGKKQTVFFSWNGALSHSSLSRSPTFCSFWRGGGVSIPLSSSCGKSNSSEMQVPCAYVVAHHCRPLFVPVSFLDKTECVCVLCERGNKKLFIKRMTCLSEYAREPCRGRTFHTISQGKKFNK